MGRRKIMNRNGKWSRKYDECTICHTTDHTYECKGLCTACYGKKRRFENLEKIRKQTCKSAKKRYWANPEYFRKLSRDYYEKNSETCKDRSSEWRKEHLSVLDMRRVAQGGAGKSDRPFEYWNNRYYLLHVLGRKCKICNSNEKLELHHIIPEKIGGNHSVENLDVYCHHHHRHTGLHKNMKKLSAEVK